jgi:hypothetical protein
MSELVSKLQANFQMVCQQVALIKRKCQLTTHTSVKDTTVRDDSVLEQDFILNQCLEFCRHQIDLQF